MNDDLTNGAKNQQPEPGLPQPPVSSPETTQNFQYAPAQQPLDTAYKNPLPISNANPAPGRSFGRAYGLTLAVTLVSLTFSSIIVRLLLLMYINSNPSAFSGLDGLGLSIALMGAASLFNIFLTAILTIVIVKKLRLFPKPGLPICLALFIYLIMYAPVFGHGATILIGYAFMAAYFGIIYIPLIKWRLKKTTTA